MSSPDADDIKVFSGRASRSLTEKICAHLDIEQGKGTTEMFPDGEILVKLDEDVRGRDCFVVQSTYHPVNAHLMELLIYIDCLRRASARRITAVIPYFGYARQDRKDQGRTPITAKLVANLITTAGADRVLTIDLHAAQIQGFFDIPVDHMHAVPVFVDYLRNIQDELGDFAIVSPDVGNLKTANLYAKIIGGDLAIIDKRRRSGSEVESTTIIGDVKDKTVLMFDDMISTAGTITQASKIVMDKGAVDVIVSATHPVLVGAAEERLVDSPISKLIVADTIPLGDRCHRVHDRFTQLSVSQLLGDAIHRIHHHQSVSALFGRDKNQY